MRVKGVVNGLIELCSKTGSNYKTKKTAFEKKYLHIHNWTYVNLEGTNVIQRTCECGTLEERHPEIDIRLGDGKEVWCSLKGERSIRQV